MGGGSIDVWILDEDAHWRQRLRDDLSRARSIRCSLVARAGTDALLALQERPAPDVLLFDPGANASTALGLVAHLRQSSPTTSAVALSAASDDSGVLGVIRSGAVGYLRKPIEGQQLVAAILLTHSGGAPLDATVARTLVNHLHGAARAQDTFHLTSRERAIVRRMVEGGSLKVIAASLGLSPHTVDTHLRNIYAKLGVHSRSAAVAKLLRMGIV